MTSVHIGKRIVIGALGFAGLGIAFHALTASAQAARARPAHSAQAATPDRAIRLRALSPIQIHVTQENGTEPPFRNEFWNNHRAGIYVDIVSGEPLFLSKDKYDSGTGWPSFTQPIEPGHLVTKTDSSLFTTRVEVRSRRADSHLGHVFDDGPAPTGKRFCMNSAAMRFIPAAEMAAQGYGRFLPRLGLAAAAVPASQAAREVATVAGGCFWGVQELVRKLPGVLETRVGYTGGTTPDPGYPQVHTGKTGHAEAVEIVFDPKVISYESILRTFFRLHDPTTHNRQGNDVGTQYRSAIFYHDDQQRKVAEQVRAEVDRSGKWPARVVTQIVPAGKFYLAEEYHQDYLQKHPNGYTCHYLRD